MFKPRDERDTVYVNRDDARHPLSAFSRHAFELDGAEWPSAEHYYQAMKFTDAELQARIRAASDPAEARKQARQFARRHKRALRKDWEKMKRVIMTRAIYIKCRTHAEVAAALLATGEAELVDNSQYDYYWGAGRDFRGGNHFGRLLMDVRARLREERTAG